VFIKTNLKEEKISVLLVDDHPLFIVGITCICFNGLVEDYYPQL